MLVGERPLVLCVALQAEIVRTGGLQIISGIAAMRIMAVDTGHLGLADRVMVREIGLSVLLFVTAHALLVEGAAGLNGAAFALFARFAGVNGVAVDAAHVLRLVRAREPIPHMLRLGMA